MSWCASRDQPAAPLPQAGTHPQALFDCVSSRVAEGAIS